MKLCPNWNGGCDANHRRECYMSHNPPKEERILLLEKEIKQKEDSLEKMRNDLESLRNF